MKIHVEEGVDGDYKLQPDIPTCTRRNPILCSRPKAPLDARLSNCPIDIANRNLLATTQLWASDIDMDQQEIPGMNCKKRGVSFAQQRLEGRTDSNNLFSSIKSICGLRYCSIILPLVDTISMDHKYLKIKR